MMPTVEFKERLELTFSGIPDRATREAIKAVGFQFDGRRTVWWLKEKNIEYRPGSFAPVFVDGWKNALLLLVRRGWATPEECMKLTARRDDEHTRAGERGMEEACGII